MSAPIAQPPVDRTARASEHRDFWTALVLGVVAIVLLFAGAQNGTRVASTGEENATETQLIKAFTAGGLHASPSVKMPDLATYRDPAEAAAALDRLAEEEKDATFPIRYRVTLGAADPCPT